MTQSPSQLKALIDHTKECINSLNALNINTDSWDAIIIFLVIQKLDSESHKAWETYVSGEFTEDMPTFSQLTTFLESQICTLELTLFSTMPQYKIRERSHAATAVLQYTCTMCKENHRLCHCKEFGKLQPRERSEFVRNLNLCYNCLGSGHTAWKCRIPMSCHICKKRHHTLLHETDDNNPDNIQTQCSHIKDNEEELTHNYEETNDAILTHFAAKKSTALLATAMVPVRDEKGQITILRALIDQGSQANFISEQATQLLKVKRTPTHGSITGVGSTQTTVKHVIQVELLSRHDEDFKLMINAYVMATQVTSHLPSKSLQVPIHTNWPHLEGLTLADPSFHQKGRIDMLLGVETYSQILKSEVIKGPPGTPCAQNTNLGWILFGKIQENFTDNIIVMHHIVNIDDMLRNFWEIDIDTRRKLTKEEEKCEEIYERTYKRNIEGRYIVKLPFNTDQPKSPEGNTKEIAMKRYRQLEKRFERDSKFQEEYRKVIEEYVMQNHMEEVPEHEINNPAVYLPHHAVVREDKETSKVRIVFNASSKGTNNISLNDELMVGPQLQDDMRSLVLRWRMKRYGFMADVKGMYRQILVTKEDSDYQRLLWVDNKTGKVKDYRLLRVTFGTASAPYLAVKTLHKIAEEEGKGQLDAAKIIKEDFFMDDLMSGEDSVQKAIATAKNITAILKNGGFELQKWASNSIELLKEFQPTDRSAQVNINLKLDGTIRALGLSWNMGEDKFKYHLKLPPIDKVTTKRTILAEIQKLFDPLGWLAPALIPAKLIIQKLWLEGSDWDVEVKPETKKEWLEIRKSYDHLQDIELERWLHTTQETIKNVTIHGFCDASEKAYGAVAYLRIQDENGKYHISLIAAKTRVAPVKPMSLPRLELCGAVLLSTLLKQISDATRIPKGQIYAWTDSTIVLSWLQGDPARWQTFVRNRIVTILDNISNNWYHVQSSENPADVASRGMLLQELKKYKLWWQGPEWLKQENIELIKATDNNSIDLERRKNITSNVKIENDSQNEINLLSKFGDFETLTELVRTIAYCRRFLSFKKKETLFYTKNITTNEQIESLEICIQLTQNKCFLEEIKDLKGKGKIKGKSILKSLNPYLDSRNILRVGGRIKHANIEEDRKHPIILDDKNELAGLIIADAHSKTLHGGVQLMLNYIRSKYWIIKVKKMVKTYVHKCIVCIKQSATTRTQLMGDLPKARVTPARPFLNCGVDFAGPYQILMSRGRGAKTYKSYIAIFVCMATKAIHLELVGDLTSEAFIGAFRRFVARRGKCNHMWSDQGRNLVGANKELQDAWKEAKLEFEGKISATLASDGTQWHFIPAYSPNFGGLWEAGVKSVKHHLKRILNANLTFEEMSTVLCQIEACLNSRPLCPIDDTDVDRLDVLTPGHFLIGEAPIIVPSPNLKDVTMSHLSRWRYTQKILNDFWQIWQQEYLTRLQQRPKWMKQVEEFEIGQIVLIKTDGLPPGKWNLGRIMDKHPGLDGITRVYSVKSGTNIVKRTVTKLCMLPIEN